MSVHPGNYAASAPTLQCAPSESTNCASTPPKSCFSGGSDARHSPLQRNGGAGMLAKAGLIAHSHDDVEIIDRKKLEEQPVSYGLMQRQVKAWQGGGGGIFLY